MVASQWGVLEFRVSWVISRGGAICPRFGRLRSSVARIRPNMARLRPMRPGCLAADLGRKLACVRSSSSLHIGRIRADFGRSRPNSVEVGGGRPGRTRPYRAIPREPIGSRPRESHLNNCPDGIGARSMGGGGRRIPRGAIGRGGQGLPRGRAPLVGGGSCAGGGR